VKLNLPLIVICYKRPELTKKILAQVFKFKKENIYIFCDAASNPESWGLVEETRRVIMEFGKIAKIKTLFNRQNSGCGMAVKTALDWFFSENRNGVILEDDTFPSLSFFGFMEENLLKYKDDSSVASVTGFCPWPDFFRPNVPVLKSKYFSMWGWGTWARVWKDYKLNVDDILAAQWSLAIRRACDSDNENEFWQNVLVKIKNKEIDTWDYQFFFQSWAQNQVHIRPPNNLVQNLGFGADATHTGVEPWFVKAQKTPLTADEPHWFLDAAYFYFRHLTYLDNGNFSLELASKKFQELAEENRKLKLELQGNSLWRPFRKIFKKISVLKTE